MSLPTKVGLGSLCALLAAILTIALWPASEADKARGDGEQFTERVSDAEDALSRAADGFVGAVTTESGWDQELYEAELDDALADLDDQFTDTRENAPEVEQAFWDGFDSTFETA